MNNNNPEIQKFLESVQAEVKQSGQQCETIVFTDFWDKKYSANNTSFDVRAFLSDVTMLQNNNQILYYQELTSYNKGLSFIVKFVKRVIRKLVAFLFIPIVNSQNEVNANVARISHHLRAYVNKDRKYVNSFVKREKELEQKVEMQNEMINELSAQLEQMKARLDSLENGGNK